MAQLPLHRRDIAGFLHDEHAHAVPGRMRCVVFIDAGKIPDLIPHRIDPFRVQPKPACGGRRSPTSTWRISILTGGF
ncbi:MAG: hypothetical protein VR65_01790 [Desulfobulbaceae bacterium BRH_c16a]|nr:MAG: hypothetical protein VR65_01790 [Desulfobulbaceae bacterium BRH_c16a]